MCAAPWAWRAAKIRTAATLNSTSTCTTTRRSIPNQTRWGYAVFGKVVQGMDVVDKIGNVVTSTHGLFKDTPVQPVVIERIERVAAP